MTKFTQETIEKIKADPDLFAAVCKDLGIRPTSLLETMKRNGNKLNNDSTVKLVADHLDVDPSTLVEVVSEELSCEVTSPNK
jgi:hypothetical protein